VIILNNERHEVALVFGFFGWNFACLTQFLGKKFAYLTEDLFEGK